MRRQVVIGGVLAILALASVTAATVQRTARTFGGCGICPGTRIEGPAHAGAASPASDQEGPPDHHHPRCQHCGTGHQGETHGQHDHHKNHGHQRGEHKDHGAGNHQDKETAPPGSVKVGDKVPDFSVRTLDGKTVKLSELQRDEKRTKNGVVLLSFWCTTCHSCRDLEHLLAQLSKDYAVQAAVLALDANADETAERVAAFLKKCGLELPVILDPSGGTADLFGVRRTTTTVVIDGNGVLRYCGQFRQKGGGSAEEALKAVLAGKEVAVKTTPHNG